MTALLGISAVIAVTAGGFMIGVGVALLGSAASVAHLAPKAQ